MAVNRIRRNGSYAPLSAHYYKDDAIDEAGEAAELLYVRGLAFCADVLSDGFISDRQLVRFVGVGMFDAVERADQLVKVGLWQREEGGYRVRSWLDWNRSRSEISDSMAKDRARKGGAAASDRPDPDPPSGGGQLDDRIPNGIPPESELPLELEPDGIQPRARTPLHDTTRQDTAGGDAEPPRPDDGFDEFWKLFPNKVKKQDARRSWATKVVKTKTDPAVVLTALRGHIVRWQAEREYPKYVPHPTTWLNGRRWLDELTQPPLHPLQAVRPPASDPAAVFDDLRARADAQAAARLLCLTWIEPPQPPSDQTPYPEWSRRHRLAFIDHHAAALRAALAERAAG